MKKTILIADDEINMQILLHDFFVSKGFEVITASNGEEAIDKFNDNPQVNLIILDVMMPILNGWKACEKIKENSDVPIIMLTAKSEERDELYSFQRGAEEYIRKPFSLVILLARVESLLKRHIDRKQDFKKGLLYIRYDRKSVQVNGELRQLSKHEFEILYYLVENEGRVISRDTILENIWGFDYEGTNRTVDTHITRLKNKLGEAKKYIVTVRGYGYKFEVPE